MGMKSPFPSKILNDSHDNDNHDMHVSFLMWLTVKLLNRLTTFLTLLTVFLNAP